jgi:hypothetical protein
VTNKEIAERIKSDTEELIARGNDRPALRMIVKESDALLEEVDGLTRQAAEIEREIGP